MNPSIWPRLLYRFSRALSALDAGQRIVRDELLFAFLPPSERTSLTLDAYQRSRQYVAGGEYFSQGLWTWEAALLEDPRIPRSGRVLLGAAGGGRELRALLERGYEVFAFEPVRPLFETALGTASGANAQVVQATYQDLVARARGIAGPLDGLRGRVDLCILGWGSLSHLTEPNAALETLRALRALAPDAPVIASFILRGPSGAELKGGARRLRHGLRRLLSAAGGQPVPAGLKLGTDSGFFYEFSVSEVRDLCADAGYQVAQFGETPYPHALLVPLAATGKG